jgi:hypothetical protein
MDIRHHELDGAETLYISNISSVPKPKQKRRAARIAVMGSPNNLNMGKFYSKKEKLDRIKQECQVLQYSHRFSSIMCYFNHKSSSNFNTMNNTL